jgi:hypothetical protein
VRRWTIHYESGQVSETIDARAGTIIHVNVANPACLVIREDKHIRYIPWRKINIVECEEL